MSWRIISAGRMTISRGSIRGGNRRACACHAAVNATGEKRVI
jgi:hypothetical protein